MSDLPSIEAKIQVEATRFRSAVSEFLAQGIGSSINFLIDENTSQDSRITVLENKTANIVKGALAVSPTITMSVTITPSVLTNEIFLHTQPGTSASASPNIFLGGAGSKFITLTRGVTTIGVWTSGIGGERVGLVFTDAPGVATPVTYTITLGGASSNLKDVRLVATEVVL